MSDTEACADCGKPIQMNEGSYYRKGPADDIGKTYHTACGDPLGIKAKDAEIERLRSILAHVANDSRAWQLHEHTKELLKPFLADALDALPTISKADGLKMRAGHPTPDR
jgi:hypothetical protein